MIWPALICKNLCHCWIWKKINLEFKTEECISTGYMVIRRRYNV